ncbi:MAG: alpha/beta fold hydrolase, partial [Bacteroidota bacterium]
DKEAPLIIISPAMGVRASYYEVLAKQFADQGFNACTIDYRGTGASSLRASRKVNFGYEDLIRDLKEVVAKLREEFPSNKMVLLGHSLGGQIGGVALSRYPGMLDGLVLIASCMVYWKGWEDAGSGRVKLVVNLFPIIAKLVGYFPGKQVGFGGREARTVMRDWGINGTKGIYQPTGSTFDYEEALKKFSTPVLAMSLEGDSFAPQNAVGRLVSKLGPDSQNKKYRHISAQEAGMEKLTHFNWAKEPGFFVKTVGEWVEDLG